MSIHPTMTNKEINYICDAIKSTSKNYKAWELDYIYNPIKNEFAHKDNSTTEKDITKHWFNL
jgi:hypothetical protein